MDSREVLITANFIEKKTGYPQLWRTVSGFNLEGKTSQTKDGLIDSLKWNKGSRDAKDDDL